MPKLSYKRSLLTMSVHSSPGSIQYSCFPNTNGGIVDDLLVYRMEDKDGAKNYLLVVNAGNMAKDWEWIQSFKAGDVHIENQSDDTALLALQGTKGNRHVTKTYQYQPF
jgi:glycine cleavage system aminomethyltransferase T